MSIAIPRCSSLPTRHALSSSGPSRSTARCLPRRTRSSSRRAWPFASRTCARGCGRPPAGRCGGVGYRRPSLLSLLERDRIHAFLEISMRRMWTLSSLVIVLICTGAAALDTAVVSAQRGRGAASAANEDTGPFGALRWRNIGPNRGGRSIAVAGSDARPLEYYFGATGGGLWKTTDGGTTWRPVTDGQIHASSVGAIGVAPSNPD